MSDIGKRRVRYAVRAAILAASAALMVIMAIGVWDIRRYYIMSLIVAVISTGFFFARFEGRRPKSREIVIPAVLTGVAVASRLLFFAMPQFKPIAAVVIIAGIAFGAETGFMTGSLSIFVSNMFLGQGPWTPWQMLGLGLVGFFAGLIFKTERSQSRWGMTAYGFLSVILIYGFIVDTYSAFSFMYDLSLLSVLGVYAAGVPFNAVFAFCTALTLFIFAKPLLQKLERVKLKYGIVS